ncbi:MAG: bile acid:sodium symporter [Planctomycetaceae bacterium]|nr:bile acid:sodium symporter [Planctomycetaceae bacterium]
MLHFIHKQWFLFGLTLFISAGLWWGYHSSAENINQLTSYLAPKRLTQIVLYLMAFSLNSRLLYESFRYPGPVLLSASTNYIAIPLAGMFLMQMQIGIDFQIGLMISASTPCTMAAASVWTRKAKGNDAVSLLVTILTNGICFVVTPFWLTWAIGSEVQLDTGEMVWRLVLSVLLPVSLGQLSRLIPPAARFADRYKTPLGVIAQLCVLFLVFAASCRGGLNIKSAGEAPGVQAILLVTLSAICLHFLGMILAWQAGKWFNFARRDRIAMLFAGSQKTLPIGVLVATDPMLFGNPDYLGPGQGIPFVVFPMLLFHGSQLFIDTFIANKIAAQPVEDQTG